MTKQLAIVAILGLFLFEHGVCTCLNAETSEGIVVLQEGQRACAPLRSTDTIADKGKRFVTCSHGNAFLQLCPINLRFDTQSGTCNWPQSATCETVVLQTGVLVALTRSSPRPPRLPPTGPCTTTNCQLPDCFCFGSSPAVENPPMFIMLSFDGPVSSYVYNTYYKSLAVDNSDALFNPNGCKPKFAFYVSHDNTDYTNVKDLWASGHEIGSNTMHRRLPRGGNESYYLATAGEIYGIVDEMWKSTRNNTLAHSVTGFRAPDFRVSGNIQYDVLRNYGFGYDTSMLNTNVLQNKEPHWPFTLDFVVRECSNPPCPTKQYPGMWEVSANSWVGDDKDGCNMLDSCIVGPSPWVASEQQWYDFFKRHFETYFYAKKVPMPFPIQSTVFVNYPNSFRALTRWLQDTLRTRPDVWLATPQQVISWMKSPQTSIAMKEHKWGC